MFYFSRSVFRLLFLSFRKGEFAWSRWCGQMCIRVVPAIFAKNQYTEETVTVTYFSVICVCVFKSIAGFHIQQCSRLPKEIRWESSDYIYITSPLAKYYAYLKFYTTYTNNSIGILRFSGAACPETSRFEIAKDGFGCLWLGGQSALRHYGSK